MSDQTSMAHRLGQRFGSYRLDRLLGRGRMGVVYAATDLALLRPTALKVLAWDLGDNHGQNPLEWFLTEARNVARINHSRVVQIYGVGEHEGTWYIAMELVDGPAADTRIAKQGPMSAGLATRTIVDVARALEAAHGVQIVHRDVKPANVLLPREGGAKLGDFGLSRAIGGRWSVGGQDGLRAGTPYYSAPELWRRESATPSTDVYALGATLHFFLTGKPPYPGKDIEEVRQQHLEAPLPDPRETRPNLPDDVVTLVQRAMAKKEDERFPSAAAFEAEARAVQRQLARAPSPWARPGPLSGPSAEPGSSGPSLEGLETPHPLLADLGFVRRPFATVNPLALPYRGGPFARGLLGLNDAVRSGPGLAVLVGRSVSGRSTVAKVVEAERKAERDVVRIVLSPFSSKGSLTRALREHGLEEVEEKNGSANQLQGADRREELPLLIVDEVGSEVIEELTQLISDNLARPRMGLLAVAEASLSDAVLPLFEDHFFLDRLRPSEVTEYIDAWLRTTRSPDAPPLLITPDARLVIVERSGGALGRVNRLVENALLLAARDKRRVVTSFEVWTAPTETSWIQSGGTLDDGLPHRPEVWPSPEAQDALRDLRARTGPGGLRSTAGETTNEWKRTFDS